MLLRALFLCAVISTALTEDNDKQAREVKISSGKVRGYKAGDDDFYAFYNIPYATAPTGPHRYRAALPAPVWLDTFDAVDRKIICPQPPMFVAQVGDIVKDIEMTENCLVASVYVPDTEEKNLPVVVLVHGGAYQIGYGNMAVPKSLLKSKKFIAVTFNYRLSLHGFLCLGTEDAPGNAGMKDMVAALRWVKKNIASFGGNPDDVTIEGYSAGSSAVDLLLISKMARGLFKRVIPESGANVAAWSAVQDPLQYAKDYAKTFGVDTDDVYELEEFYKTTPFTKLIHDSFLNRTDSTFLFAPCVERDTGTEVFLDDSPVNILTKGDYNKVPVLYGFANMEGLFRIPNFDDWKNKMNKKFSDFLPADLQFESEEQKEEVAEEIKQFYFGDQPVSDDTVVAYVDYFTDVLFGYATVRSARLQVAAGSDSIYLYEYSFVEDAHNYQTPPHLADKLRGANHCAQTFAVLDSAFVHFPNLSDAFEQNRVRLRQLWLNFITTGSPVPPGSSFVAWPAAGADGAPYMSLGETMQLKGALLEERVRFWDGIYERHYRQPVPPPQPPPRKHTEL